MAGYPKRPRIKIKTVRLIAVLSCILGVILAFIAIANIDNDSIFNILSGLIIAIIVFVVIFIAVFYKCPHCGRAIPQNSGDKCTPCGKYYDSDHELYMTQHNTQKTDKE